MGLTRVADNSTLLFPACATGHSPTSGITNLSMKQPEPLTFEEKHHFLLRKLHSLSGIVPIGVFLIEHLMTNSLAAGWASSASGRDRFNEAVHDIHHLPYLWALELFGIFLPLGFHALYGIQIALSARPNAREYPYMANR